MRIGFLEVKNLGFQDFENIFYVKNHRDKLWTKMWFPNEKLIRGVEAIRALLGLFLSVERRHSDDLFNESTNILIDKKNVNKDTQKLRIQFSFCIKKMREIGLTLPDVQYHKILLESIEKNQKSE